MWFFVQECAAELPFLSPVKLIFQKFSFFYRYCCQYGCALYFVRREMQKVCPALKYVLPFEVRLMWSNFEKVSNNYYISYTVYDSTLTPRKMANANVHQRNILRIQNPVEVLIFRLRTTVFTFLILSRDTVPLESHPLNYTRNDC
jgi:hypothetical protein